MVVQCAVALFWVRGTEKSSANDFWHGRHVKLRPKQQFLAFLGLLCSILYYNFSWRVNHLLLFLCFLESLEKGFLLVFFVSFHFSFGRTQKGSSQLSSHLVSYKKQGALGLVLSICCQLPFLSWTLPFIRPPHAQAQPRCLPSHFRLEPHLDISDTLHC